MYKHTYTSTSERYLLEKKIQEKITNRVDDFMKKIELSLLYNAYPKINENKMDNELYSSFEKLSNSFQNLLIKERINRINIDERVNNILNLDQITSKRMLISLYEYYLREEMVEYTDNRNITISFRDWWNNISELDGRKSKFIPFSLHMVGREDIEKLLNLWHDIKEKYFE